MSHRDMEIAVKVSDDFGDDEVRIKERWNSTMSTKRIAETLADQITPNEIPKRKRRIAVNEKNIQRLFGMSTQELFGELCKKLGYEIGEHGA